MAELKQTRLQSIYVLNTVILCETGLHIGGSEQKLEIAGIDLPIIKNPITGEPYIPGSSLKGKMRSSIEKKHGRLSNKNQDPCNCGKTDCPVCPLFGAHKNPRPQCGTTRILVRDAHLTKQARQELRDLVTKGEPFLEVKTENIIDRKTGTAQHPRDIERVPAGTKFELEIVLQVYEGDDFERFKKTVKEALELVEQTYLGGMGSRGYGKVRFSNKDDWQICTKTPGEK